MKIAKLIVVVAALALTIQPAFSQSDANSQKSASLRAHVLAPLHLGAHAGKAKPAAAPTNDAVAMGLATARVYKFASADYPGAATSLVFDENITTLAILGDTQFTSASGFTLKGGNYQLLTLPGSLANISTGINSTSVIVGEYTDTSNTVHGFRFSGGVVTNIDDPNSTTGNTIPFDINDGGEIVGSYIDSSNVTHGFSTPDGVNFTTIDFPASIGTIAAGVDTAGDVVGQWEDASNMFHGFLLKGGVFTSFDFPLAKGTTAIGINDSGEIAGYYTDTSNVDHGFIYTAGNFIRVDVSGANSTQLTRIKKQGQITGLYSDVSSEEHGLTGH